MQGIKKVEIKNKAQEILYSTAGVFIMLGAYAMTPVTCPFGAVLGLTANGVKCGPRREDETEDQYAWRKKRIRKNNKEAMLKVMKYALELPYEAFANLRGLALQDGRVRIEKYNKDMETKKYLAARNAVRSQDPALLDKLNKEGLGSLLEFISNSRTSGTEAYGRGLSISEGYTIYEHRNGFVKSFLTIPEDLRIYIKAAIDIRREEERAQRKARDEEEQAQAEAKRIADIDAKIKESLAAACHGSK